jgi:hypothetical protein
VAAELGSVAVVAPAVLVLVVVPAPELVPVDETVELLALEPADDEVEPAVEEPEEPDPLLDPEPEPEPLPEPFPPPRGSTYCWSPADGPEASAAAGAKSTSASSARRRIGEM